MSCRVVGVLFIYIPQCRNVASPSHAGKSRPAVTSIRQHCCQAHHRLRTLEANIRIVESPTQSFVVCPLKTGIVSSYPAGWFIRTRCHTCGDNAHRRALGSRIGRTRFIWLFVFSDARTYAQINRIYSAVNCCSHLTRSPPPSETRSQHPFQPPCQPNAARWSPSGLQSFSCSPHPHR